MRATAIATITTETTVTAMTAATNAVVPIVSPPRSMLTPGDIPASARDSPAVVPTVGSLVCDPFGALWGNRDKHQRGEDIIRTGPYDPDDGCDWDLADQAIHMTAV